MSQTTSNELAPVAQIEAGDGTSWAIQDDGSIWFWGAYFDEGKLIYQTEPIELSEMSGMFRVGDFSAGGLFQVLLDSSGEVWAWGKNVYQQTGVSDNNVVYVYKPNRVDSLSGIVAVSAGYSHSLALASDGTVWAWGDNNIGKLGVVEDVGGMFAEPQRIEALNEIIAVAAGHSHSLALRHDGTVWAWGYADCGSLGDGVDHVDQAHPSPVQVSSLSDVIAIDVREGLSLALDSQGDVWWWGEYCYQTEPAKVSGLSDIVAIEAGNDHGVALRTDGTVWTFGSDNHFGQFGSGEFEGAHMLAQQVVGPEDVVAISAGAYHNLALTKDNQIWAWGSNLFGELGDGTLENSAVPIQVFLR